MNITIDRTTPALSRYQCLSVLCLACCLFTSAARAQSQSPTAVKPDYSREAFVSEQDVTRVVFENDGTARRETTARIRIQSDAGVQRYGLLTLPYTSLTPPTPIAYSPLSNPDPTRAS